MIILDTDGLSHLRADDALGRAINAGLDAVTDQDQRITVVSAAEMLRGQLLAIEKQEKAPKALMPAYGFLDDLLEFLADWQGRGLVLPYSGEAERIYRGFPPRLRQGVGNDARIAAIALEHGAEVWTLNVRHFRLVPNLTVVQADSGLVVSGPPAPGVDPA